VRKRLLTAGTAALEHLFALVSQGLSDFSQAQQPSALSLAPFASQVVALDESTLDRLRRLTADVRDLPTGDPHLLPGNWRVCSICVCNAGCACSSARMCWLAVASAC
jgi:hypothetical protein